MVLERHELDGFLVLAEELHFGRAAERLRVSRAHVSQTIKKLERRIGAPLFVRTSRQVALTPLGEQLREDLAPHARGITEAVHRAIATAHGTTGTLRVGFVGALWGQLFVLAADAFRAGHPDCEVELREYAFGVAQEPVRSGELDLMNASFPVREPDLTAGPPVVREPRVLAISSAHPLAARSELTLADLDGLTMIRTPTMPAYWSRSRTLGAGGPEEPAERGAQATSLQEGLALIAAGKGAYPVGAQVVRFYRRPDLAYVPITDAPPLDWGLVWRRGNDTPLLCAFARVVTEVARTSGHPGTSPEELGAPGPE
ncbi:LysR family transcriptional regulator [Streptomyces bambusae]|uniref:LysR family transcriptional regulator n=1 Tax=Streptomyces bambusae TaxID=1550616 RepID=UPI001CFF820C|nr:LysR substrate-binding domain-containing protein [Streptomyces bambusae]MCB5169882.1 LysR family transcriptional regulator [Streptomyces bambusae]